MRNYANCFGIVCAGLSFLYLRVVLILIDVRYVAVNSTKTQANSRHNSKQFFALRINLHKYIYDYIFGGAY